MLLVGAAEDPGDEEVAALSLSVGRAVTLPGPGHIGVFLASELMLPHALGVLDEGFT